LKKLQPENHQSLFQCSRYLTCLELEIYFLMAWSIGDTLQALFSLVRKHSLFLTLSSVTNNLCIKSYTLGSIRYCGLDHEIWFVSQITPFRSCLERVLMKIFFERRPTTIGQTSFFILGVLIPGSAGSSQISRDSWRFSRQTF